MKDNQELKKIFRKLLKFNFGDNTMFENSMTQKIPLIEPEEYKNSHTSSYSYLVNIELVNPNNEVEENKENKTIIAIPEEDSFQQLPEDTQLRVLSFLPYEHDLISASLTSKNWKNLVSKTPAGEEAKRLAARLNALQLSRAEIFFSNPKNAQIAFVITACSIFFSGMASNCIAAVTRDNNPVEVGAHLLMFSMLMSIAARADQAGKKCCSIGGASGRTIANVVAITLTVGPEALGSLLRAIKGNDSTSSWLITASGAVANLAGISYSRFFNKNQRHVTEVQTEKGVLRAMIKEKESEPPVPPAEAAPEEVFLATPAVPQAPPPPAASVHALLNL